MNVKNGLKLDAFDALKFPVIVIFAPFSVPVKVGDAVMATDPVPLIAYSPRTPALSKRTRVSVPLVIVDDPTVRPPAEIVLQPKA